MNANIVVGWDRSGIRQPTDYEKSVLTCRPERCAVSRKSATGICRNIIIFYIKQVFPSSFDGANNPNSKHMKANSDYILEET